MRYFSLSYSLLLISNADFRSNTKGNELELVFNPDYTANSAQFSPTRRETCLFNLL